MLFNMEYGRKKSGGWLPTGYTEVEYIASTGSSYDNGATLYTWYAPSTNNFEIKYKMYPTAIRTSRNYFYWWSNAWLSSEYWSSSVAYNTWSSTWICKHSLSVNTLYELDITYNNWTQTVLVNGSTYSQWYSWTVEGKWPLYFFGAWQTDAHSQERIYYIQLYDDWELVMDLVPCTNSSNVAGMYDLVGKQFYSSANSYVFTAWPAV